MHKLLISFLVTFVMSMLIHGVYAEDKINPLPFPVKIGGQEAKVESEDARYAIIEQPVALNATVEVNDITPLLMLNLFKYDEKGVLIYTLPPFVVKAQNTNRVQLDQTLHQLPLDPAKYLVFVIQGDKGTARILLTIKAPLPEVESPNAQ